MIDPKIIEQISEAWRADENHPHRSRVKRALPATRLLTAFVDSAFLTTLRQEEGQPIRFSAVLVGEAEWRTATQFPGRVHKLDRPIPFAPSSVAKIAPAFDPNLSSLAVAAGENSDELTMWGVFSYVPPKNFFNELPVGIDGGTLGRPDFFTVSSSHLGSLVISRHYSMIGRLASGYFSRAQPTPLQPLSLGRHWVDLQERGTLRIRYGSDFERISWWAIQVLLNEASTRGHGGTIAVVDPNRSLNQIQLGYALGDDFQARSRLTELIEHQRRDRAATQGQMKFPNIAVDLAYRKAALESLQRLAQLAAIDGALVIDCDFAPITFGAKFTGEGWAGRTLVGPDGWGNADDAVFDISRYGTRHTSAVNFAAANTGAIVFVLSQDGPIRAFVRVNDSTILCWPDCSTTMFVA